MCFSQFPNQFYNINYSVEHRFPSNFSLIFVVEVVFPSHDHYPTSDMV